MDRQGVALQWGIVMHDPLLPDRARQRGVEHIDALALEEPAWAAAFFGGVAADIAGTLPAEDPWRTLSGTAGSIHRGNARLPPGVSGATWPSGAMFGEWADFTDVTPLVSDVPETDPELAAVADPLDPAGVAVIPFAFDGWRSAAGALASLSDTGLALGPVGREAVRVLIIRRRSYGVESDDPWIIESIFDWGWRAEKVVEGWVPDDDALAERIARERIT